MALAERAKALISTRSIFTASLIIAMATLASKATGFVRIQAIAGYFGASWETDAFLTAFLIPECIYLFFTEGALSAALVPLFTGYFNDGEKEKVHRGQVLLSTLSIIIAITGLSFGLGMYVFRVEVAATLGPQFSYQTRMLAATLLGIICGYIPLGLLGGLYQGYLNSRGHFLAPAMGPLLFNIVTIGGAVLFGSTLGIKALAIAVLMGGFIALIINMGAVKVVGTKILVMPDFHHEGLYETFRLLGPVIFSLILVQTQICTERMMASSLPEGSISSLNFASKLLNLPAGLFALTAATALLPVLSRSIASNNKDEFISSSNASHTALMIAVAPLGLLLSLFSTEIVVAAFKRGAFEMSHALVTGNVLFYYGLTLIPLAGTFLLTRIFFASGDTKTPAYVKMVTTTANIVFLSVFIERWGIIAVPVAFFTMYGLNYLTLVILFEKRYPSTERTMKRVLGTTIVSVCLCAGAYKGFLVLVQSTSMAQLFNVYTMKAIVLKLVSGTIIVLPVFVILIHLSGISYRESLKQLKSR